MANVGTLLVAAVVTGVLMGAGACGSSSSGGGGGWLPASMTNDSAVLNGVEVGNCSLKPKRKTVPIEVTAGSAEYTLGTAFMAGTTLVPEYATLYVPVTNIGTATQCFISASDYAWLDSAGTSLLTTTSGPYVDGSVRDVGITTYTSTCLAPGETGLIIDINNVLNTDLVTAVAKVRLSIGASTSTAPVLPLAAVVPVSYSVSGSALTVTARNVGTGPAGFTSTTDIGSHYMILDGTRLPVDFAYFTGMTPASDSVLPNGTGTLVHDPSDVAAGCGPHVWALVAFDKPTTTAASTVSGALTLAGAGATEATGHAAAARAWLQGRAARFQAYAAAHKAAALAVDPAAAR